MICLQWRKLTMLLPERTERRSRRVFWEMSIPRWAPVNCPRLHQATKHCATLPTQPRHPWRIAQTCFTAGSPHLDAPKTLRIVLLNWLFLLFTISLHSFRRSCWFWCINIGESMRFIRIWRENVNRTPDTLESYLRWKCCKPRTTNGLRIVECPKLPPWMDGR